MLFVVPSVGGLAAAYAAIWGWRSLGAGLAVNLWELAVLLLAIALHELITGVTWAWFSGKGFGAIRYGFHLATLTPFAHPKEPIPVVPYAIGALMPGLVLGVLPCLVAMLLGCATLMLFGLAMTVAAGGDLLVVWLLRGTGRRSLVRDHPSRGGLLGPRRPGARIDARLTEKTAMKAMKAGVTKIDCPPGLSVVTESVRRLFLDLAAALGCPQMADPV